jgi:hypothetical protein
VPRPLSPAALQHRCNYAAGRTKGQGLDRHVGRTGSPWAAPAPSLSGPVSHEPVQIPNCHCSQRCSPTLQQLRLELELPLQPLQSSTNIQPALQPPTNTAVDAPVNTAVESSNCGHHCSQPCSQHCSVWKPMLETFQSSIQASLFRMLVHVLELGPPAQARWGRLPRRRQARGKYGSYSSKYSSSPSNPFPTCCHAQRKGRLDPMGYLVGARKI